MTDGTTPPGDGVVPPPSRRQVLADVAAAVRLSAHVMARDPEQVENQLRGRLPSAVLAHLHDAPIRSGPWLRLDSPSLALAGGPLLRTLEGHTNLVGACAFSPDGRTALFGAYDGALRLWDLASEQTRHVLAGHTGRVGTCAFGPDGRLAVSASADRTLRLWDLASGHELARFEADIPLKCCAFSPLGERVIAGDQDGAVHFLTVVGAEGLPAVAPPGRAQPQPMSAADLAEPGAQRSSPAPSPGIQGRGDGRRHRWPFWRRR